MRSKIHSPSLAASKNRRGPEVLRHHRQQGDALIEALVAIVLTFTIATGLCFVVARVMQAQRYQITQHAVLSEVARQLSLTGVSSLCETGAGLTLSIGTGLAAISTDAPTCVRAAVSVAPEQPDHTLAKTIIANQVYTSFSIITSSSTLLGGGSGLSVGL